MVVVLCTLLSVLCYLYSVICTLYSIKTLSDSLTHDGTFQSGEFFVQSFGGTRSPAEFINFCPKGCAVVEFLEVGEFVGDNVVDKVGGQEEEPQREVDIA